ncbi:hypothetical protein [Streptomyces sp. 12257]|uniref:hypothetical protein n=1 Tax=Streptomyces sp. 12257 TaxID=3041009 RepID=UPI0024A86702|nr:hypothetical protein [Streptomyces sp. 12257]MDI5908739.1 hypothetical protein [Streptomyces sp. 12257]
MTAPHEYTQCPTRNSGAGAVSRFATSTSITRPYVRSARESGGRSPSTIPATSSAAGENLLELLGLVVVEPVGAAGDPAGH